MHEAKSAKNVQDPFGRVGDAMSRQVIVLSPDMQASEAAELLADREVSGGPVVREGLVIGVVTLRDLLDVKGRARATSGPFPRGDQRLVVRTVADVMTRQVVTADEDWPLARAIVVMDEAGVNRLPVVDDAGRPVGILTRADVIHTMARAFWRHGGAEPNSGRPAFEPG